MSELMRCSTCGEQLDGGSARCPTCGAATPKILPPAGARRCPRCGYRGEGIAYFKRPAHIGLLAGISFCTYGFGGVVYWLARRRHRVCRQCGLGWEHATGIQPLGPGVASETTPVMAASPNAPAEPLPPSGIGRRVFGVGVGLLAVLMVLMGISEPDFALAAVGTVAAGAGSLTFWWGHAALAERRRAIMVGLQRQVLLLASEKGGELTVSEVATRLNLSLPAAEKVMDAMEDGLRVRSEITDEGLILYEFPELRPRKQLDSGSHA